MNEKISAEQRSRAAYIYIRQSTAHQVRFHLEGQKRQYALRDRARELGFAQVVVIDEDLGRSGSGLQERPGFGRLLAAVCQGLAGAVVALEASRLARNNRDWHHLVDLCAMTNTLLIDDDGIYDPKVLKDRMLLGLKGAMSEFEIGLFRQRARAAFLQKVKRGCCLWEMPVGFIRNEEAQIEKTPDRQVQQAIEMVFKKFRELGSARQAIIWFGEEKIQLPHIRPGKRGREVLWAQASVSRVHQILRNPCYAGAFAYGRTASRTRVIEGRVRGGLSRRKKPIDEWDVLIKEHHEGYISWQDYLRNREQMIKNQAPRQGQSGGAARRGSALLSGLLRCGRCGRKFQVGYSGPQSQVARYLCCGQRMEVGSGGCMSLGSLRIDQSVVSEVLEAVAPAGVQAVLQACEQAAQEDQEKRKALELALERARYEAQRAQRQFDGVEPENRLVAGELEARWNVTLKTVAELEERLREFPVTKTGVGDEQKRRLRRLGSDLEGLWEHPQAPVELKKRILRSVIHDIIVNSSESEHGLQIHWVGGVHTELKVPRNKPGMTRNVADAKVTELIKELVKVCDDKTIAAVLNRLGYRTGQGNTWRSSRVCGYRYTHGIAGCEKRADWLTLEAAALELNVGQWTIKSLIKKSVLPARQVVECAPWVIERSDLNSKEVQAAVQVVKSGKRIPSRSPGQQELPIKQGH